ncbi:hypothetical protein TNCV_4785421 [Trichonephila clavipes]|nr:hypothetical protein TNCV_4785421 [Trichonephila clavipes]
MGSTVIPNSGMSLDYTIPSKMSGMHSPVIFLQILARFIRENFLLPPRHSVHCVAKPIEVSGVCDSCDSATVEALHTVDALRDKPLRDSPSSIVAIDANCSPIEPGFKTRRRHGCL